MLKRHGMRWFAIMIRLYAPVAQLDRVLVSEAKGRGFDSRRAHHFYDLFYFFSNFNINRITMRLNRC